MSCKSCGSKIKYIAHGAKGLAKSTVGVGVASDSVINRRREICRACPEAVPCKHNSDRYCTCQVCGCSLKHKTRLASESCPKGKWDAVDAAH